MAINPKTLIPDLKRAMGACAAGMDLAPQQMLGRPVLSRADLALREAWATCCFVAAALGDAGCLAEVCSWPLDASADVAVQHALAGRSPAELGRPAPRRGWADAAAANKHPAGCRCDWCADPTEAAPPRVPPVTADELSREVNTGALSHPLFPLRLTRMMLCLLEVLEATGAEGARAFRQHCANRARSDAEQARLG